MNRQEWLAALEDYGVSLEDDDPHFGPGRYQGESPLVILLESWSLDGFGDPIYSECECDDGSECTCETEWEGDVFDIDDDTRAEFPEFGDAKFATYYRSEQGFCYAGFHTEAPRA